MAQVTIQTRPDGSRRFMSPLFARKDKFLHSEHPPGALLTKAAVDVVPDLPITGVTDNEGLFRYDPHAREHTVMGVSPATGIVGRDLLLTAMMADAQRALELPPHFDDLPIRGTLGEALLELDRPEEALPHLKAAAAARGGGDRRLRELVALAESRAR